MGGLTDETTFPLVAIVSSVLLLRANLSSSAFPDLPQTYEHHSGHHYVSRDCSISGPLVRKEMHRRESGLGVTVEVVQHPVVSNLTSFERKVSPTHKECKYEEIPAF